jgi:hypothetical protein
MVDGVSRRIGMSIINHKFDDDKKFEIKKQSAHREASEEISLTIIYRMFTLWAPGFQLT